MLTFLFFSAGYFILLLESKAKAGISQYSSNISVVALHIHPLPTDSPLSSSLPVRRIRSYPLYIKFFSLQNSLIALFIQLKKLLLFLLRFCSHPAQHGFYPDNHLPWGKWFADFYSDGIVSSSKLETITSEMEKKTGSTVDIEGTMAAFDADEDGSLNSDELVEMMSSKNFAPPIGGAMISPPPPPEQSCFP